MSEARSEYKPPYMPFYPRDFYGDPRVRNMTPRQRTMYLALLANAWTLVRPCYIPNDEDLWRMADADSRRQWERDKGPVLSMFTLTEDGQFYFKNRQVEEYEAISAKHSERSLSGKRGNAKRWNTPSLSDPKAIANESHSDRNQNQNQKQNHISISSNPSDLDETNESASKEPDKRNQQHVAVVQEVFSYYLDQTGRTSKLYSLTHLRKQKGLARLRECLQRTGGNLENAKKLMLLCVDQLVASDWHMGRDVKTDGKRYVEWEKQLFPDEQKLEMWWNRAEGQQ